MTKPKQKSAKRVARSAPPHGSAFVAGIRTAESWQRLHRRIYIDTYPSVRFIQAVQADAIRVAGNTAAQPGVTKRSAAISILKAASVLEDKLPKHLR